jgi:hypothetical protein
VNLTPAITELGKNMVLSGISLCLYDKEVVNQADIENNFYISNEGLGKEVRNDYNFSGRKLLGNH